MDEIVLEALHESVTQGNASTPETVEQEWHTYEKWGQLGRQVRKGAKSTKFQGKDGNPVYIFERSQTCTTRKKEGQLSQLSNEMTAHQARWWRNNAARWGSKPPAI